MLKSVIDKFIGHLGGGKPVRSSLSSESSDNGQELDAILKPPKEVTTSFQEDFPPPSPPYTPVERMGTPDQDEVLFRKNNVYLSYPKHVPRLHETSRLYTFQHHQHERTPSPQTLPMSASDNSLSASSGGPFPDNQVLVPGYLFVTTRGSNYGTTLILNWAPNSSMRTPASASPTPPSPSHLLPKPSFSLDASTTTASPKTLANGRVTVTGGVGHIRASWKEEEEINPTLNSRLGTSVSHHEHTDGDCLVATSRDGKVPPMSPSPPLSPPAVMATGRGDTFALATTTSGSSVMGERDEVRGGVYSCVGSSAEGLLGYDRPSCSSVSIDLMMMEMVRIFYNTDENGFIVNGEMVIRSKDRNFKVFRFKTGGLNELVHILRSWKYFKHHWHKESQQHTFTVFQPKLSLAELHPLEDEIPSMLTEDMWRDLKDSDGRIVDKQYVLKVIFFQGVAPPLRKEVWPFLLGLYSYDSSERERLRVKSKKLEEYWTINKRRRELEKAAALAHAGATVKTTGEVTRQTSSTPAPLNGSGSPRSSLRSSSEASGSSYSSSTEKRTHPQKKAGQVGKASHPEGRSSPPVDIKALTRQIEKDTVRTDRSHPYYKGENNINVKTLLNILLNYLIYKPEISYSQGMTDLLAPLLASLDDEAEAFWCFTKLVQSSIFYTPGKNHISIKHLLEPLCLLIQLLIPSFYTYLENTDQGLTLMFSHRWLLVCLKREFQEEDSLHIWEACWTNYETTSFHLFICIAIMAMYGQRAMDRNMNINELMVFFSTLSQSMPRDTVMSQARGYLHRFCRSSQVSCKLYPIMTSEFWEREGSPKLICEECNGLVDCPRTGFVVKKGAVC